MLQWSLLNHRNLCCSTNLFTLR